MKRFFIVMLYTGIIIFIVPLLVVYIMGNKIDNSAKDTGLIKVYFSDEGVTKEINTADYLAGVVAAEVMPEFENEALKAQAVAARTYMNYQSYSKKEHPDGAVVCTDYKHCQAWKDINSVDEDFKKRVISTVTDTGDEMITYKNKVINAMFFSTSSGKTENAYDVWGEDFPYLISVESPNEENAPNFKSEKIITAADAKKKISEQIKNADLSKPMFENIIRSDAGGIISLDIYGVNVNGTTLRSIFELRSTNAQIREAGDNIVFDVTGNGHGVGMSQFGANAMAKNGSSYKEILEHYYCGCKIK